MLVFMETNGNTEVKCPPVFAKSHRNLSRCAIINLICLVELFDTNISADIFNLLHPMSHPYLVCGLKKFTTALLPYFSYVVTLSYQV